MTAKLLAKLNKLSSLSAFQLGFHKSANTKQTYSHVYIAGLPGAGKTTLATELSKKLGYDLISLDGVPGMLTTDDTTKLSRDIIQGLDRNSVIEGVQLLNFPKQYWVNKDYRELKIPQNTLVTRLVTRGFEDRPGELVVGDTMENRKRAKSFLQSLVSQRMQVK